jgi:DNA-binding FrmR family transcriptional regulator
MRKNTISQRLNIIEGQIDGLGKLVDENSDCQKIIVQFKAINSALKKTMEIYLKENLEYCIKDMKKNKNAEFLLKEIIESK